MCTTLFIVFVVADDDLRGFLVSHVYSEHGEDVSELCTYMSVLCAKCSFKCSVDYFLSTHP